MTNPIVLTSGHTYEEAAIREYFSKSDNRCPKTRLPVKTDLLTPNLLLKSMIIEYKEQTIAGSVYFILKILDHSAYEFETDCRELLDVILELDKENITIRELFDRHLDIFEKENLDERIASKKFLILEYIRQKDKNKLQVIIQSISTDHRLSLEAICDEISAEDDLLIEVIEGVYNHSVLSDLYFSLFERNLRRTGTVNSILLNFGALKAHLAISNTKFKQTLELLMENFCPELAYRILDIKWKHSSNDLTARLDDVQFLNMLQSKFIMQFIQNNIDVPRPIQIGTEEHFIVHMPFHSEVASLSKGCSYQSNLVEKCGLQWKLLLFPNGSKYAPKAEASLYLKESTTRKSIIFSISLYHSGATTYAVSKVAQKTEFDEDWGWHSFCKYQELLESVQPGPKPYLKFLVTLKILKVEKK